MVGSASSFDMSSKLACSGRFEIPAFCDGVLGDTFFTHFAHLSSLYSDQEDHGKTAMEAVMTDIV